MFPTWNQFLDQSLPAIAIAILTGVITVAIVCYISMLHRRGGRVKRRYWGIAIVFLSFSVLLSVVTINVFVNFGRYRFDLSHVSAIRFTRIPSEGGGLLSGDIYINDNLKLKKGLPQLLTAQQSNRRHEHFSDGFRLDIVIDGDDSIAMRRTLYLYRQSSWRGNVAHIIVPYTDSPFSANWLELSSPEFLHWCEQVLQDAGGF